MSMRNLTNVAASVHARLMNRSRETGEDFQFLLQRYAAERFLYRLGLSRYRDCFVLKGAMLFPLWGGSVYRATRDLDFTGYGDSSEEAVRQCFREICAQPVEDDGLEFDTSTIRVERILDEAEYNGVRVRFEARLGDARINMQVDVGFGNAIVPAARDEEYPTLLDGPAPRIRAYPVEAVVAEKLHAIHRFGETNSRLKDFYDLYVLSEQFEFDAELLQRAVAATFGRRATPIVSTLPAGLQPRFFADDARAGQWRAYLSRSGLPAAPPDFQVVGERLRAFLGPIWDGLANGSPAKGTWQRGNGWRFGETDSGAATVPGTAVESITQVTAPVVSTGKDAVAATSASPIERPATTGLGRFKPYPAYKDSGVEWLGAIPAHWGVKHLKHVAHIEAGQSPPSEAVSESSEGLPFLQGNAEFGALSPSPHLVCDDAPKRARAGDILLSVRAPVGALNIADQSYGIGRGLCAITPGNTVEQKFCYYVLVTVRPWLDAVATGSTYDAVSVPEVGCLTILLPPLPEQRAIAAFLDRETARIDGLVEKKERLIALLQEKRTALISHAVTKGLDPTAPMKDSGVEWLGAIPAHWGVMALKRLGDFQAGAGFPHEEQGWGDEELPFYKVSDTNLEGNETFMVNHNNSISRESAARLGAFIFPPETIVFAKVGAALLLNKRRILTRESCIDNNMMGFMRKGCDLKWAYYWMCGLDLGALANPGAVPSVNEGQLRSIPVPVPPENEQRAIAAFLDRETAKIDALIAKVREAIERLKEYRTALISAAVTGKIDVREPVSA